VSWLLSDKYLSDLLDTNRLNRAAIVKGYSERLFLRSRTLRTFDVVIIHVDSLPYLPPIVERRLNRLQVPYVYDFDDAIFHQYDLNPSRLVRQLLGGKVPDVIRRATHVVAGNRYLADFACRFNSHVTVVPTTVDTTEFVPADIVANRRPVVVGWIGSPSTARYVESLSPVWKQLTSEGSITLRLIGAGGTTMAGEHVEIREWNEAREVADLQSMDIGIMPLEDDPWARGKCGFKLIQYMACGLPVVASPVGVNAQIVREGGTGFLCRTPEEWFDRIRRLASDNDLRRQMGSRGRDLACAEWSLQKWAPQIATLLRNAAINKER
jgi:glycosyltransferase involved in cell wall biosynthesis